MGLGFGIGAKELIGFGVGAKELILRKHLRPGRTSVYSVRVKREESCEGSG